MHNDTLEIVDTRQADALRAGTWALLGRLLASPPSSETLQRLAQLEPSAEDADPLAIAWAALGRAARAADGEALHREFQDVFIGVGGGEVTPYGSWYLTGTLLDRPLVRLRSDLDELGIARSEANCEPEDHAAAVCEIMALVIEDEAVDHAWQCDVFQRHAESWLARFFEDLGRAPSADFYRAVAAVGQAFVAMERKYYALPA